MKEYNLCMPLVANIPTPKDNTWEMVLCPICGKECWERNSNELKAIERVAKINKMCTVCSFEQRKE